MRLTLLLWLFSTATPVAQAGPPLAPHAALDHLRTAYDAVASHLLAASTLLPVAQYDYRPAPGTRSFGQIVAHVAGAHVLYCSQAVGDRIPATLGRRLAPLRAYSDNVTASSPRVPPVEIIALLKESVTLCRTTFDVAQANGSPSRPFDVRPLIDNLAHSNEHYGNIVTYLRLNGLVPPSTAAPGR